MSTKVQDVFGSRWHFLCWWLLVFSFLVFDEGAQAPSVSFVSTEWFNLFHRCEEGFDFVLFVTEYTNRQGRVALPEYGTHSSSQGLIRCQYDMYMYIYDTVRYGYAYIRYGSDIYTLPTLEEMMVLPLNCSAV